MIQIGHSNKKNETFRQLAPRTKKSWSPSPSDRRSVIKEFGEGLRSRNLGSHFSFCHEKKQSFPSHNYNPYHMIHVWYIYIDPIKNQPNVGKYTIYMDTMGN